MPVLFTPEELAEMAAFDAEIDAEPITNEEIRESRQRDKASKYDRKSKKEKRIAESKRAYREANRDKIAESKRAYREANRDKIAESKRAYYRDNPDKYEAHKAYMREYARRRYAEKKRGAAACD